MSKQQKNSAFVKMLKEFPKVFGRVSFRERLMLRTAFDYINEEVIADIKANCDLAIEGRDVKIMEHEQQIEKMRKKDELKKVASVWNYLRTVGAETRIAELEKENAELKRDKEDLIFVRNAKADHICELKDLLAKAKEMLQTVFDKWVEERWILQSEKEVKQIENLMKQAEQFLEKVK